MFVCLCIRAFVRLRVVVCAFVSSSVLASVHLAMCSCVCLRVCVRVCAFISAQSGSYVSEYAYISICNISL